MKALITPLSDLLRRLDPRDTTLNVNRIIDLCPSLTEELLAAVDQPLEVRRCKDSGRDYLLCDYNRDGDSYRSPWSGKFDPPLEGENGPGGADDGAGEGAIPSERIRKIEIAANDAFDIYREMYYEGGISSVYFWNLDDGFAGVVLIKKGMTARYLAGLRGNVANGLVLATAPAGSNKGVWDSIHVFEAIDRARTSHYKLTSTVILHLSAANEALGEMDLSGNLTRQTETDLPVENDSSHIANIGKLVEDMEFKMRNLLQDVYFGKTKDIVGELRSIQPLTETNRDRATHQDMINSMRKG